jgi:outer membrane receptor protein involved in Fe transport
LPPHPRRPIPVAGGHHRHRPGERHGAFPEEASYAITRFDADMLARRGPGSTADLFKDIPGFWVESTGGEASNNIRARGIPTDGYSSVAILEDGLPVQYDGGLGYLNTDQVVRSDATIDRVEAVRGGPSAIFAPNAPGGSIDFLTRNPLTRPGTSLSVTGGSTGYRRIDGFVGLRLTPRLGVSLGGFYRRDDGLRDPGYPADRGGQIRAAITYDDGRNRLSFNVKHLDDRVILYLPVPLQLDSAGMSRRSPASIPCAIRWPGPPMSMSPSRRPQVRRISTCRKARTAGSPSTPLRATSLWAGTARWRSRPGCGPDRPCATACSPLAAR